MRKYSALLCLILCASLTTHAGDNPRNYKTTARGLKYTINKKGNGGRTIMAGYYVTCRWWLKTMKDSLITSSDAYGVTPEFKVDVPKYNGDPVEGFTYLNKGDSATFLLNVDSVYKNNMPPFAKQGENLKYVVSILDVNTPAEYKEKKAMMAKKQKELDNQLILAYLKQHNITNALHTDSGLYYIVAEPGNGVKPHAGQKVTVNYTGQLLDGTVFDSNEKKEFGHVEPFSFNLGQHNVISGWDLGIPLFGVGGKGTLIIPSHLAYGEHGQGPIKANSVLIFDIELVSAE